MTKQRRRGDPLVQEAADRHIQATLRGEPPTEGAAETIRTLAAALENMLYFPDDDEVRKHARAALRRADPAPEPTRRLSKENPCPSCKGDMYHYAGCGIGEHGERLAGGDSPTDAPLTEWQFRAWLLEYTNRDKIVPLSQFLADSVAALREGETKP